MMSETPVLDRKVEEVLLSLSILGQRIDREIIRKVIVGSISLGAQCHVPPEKVSERMKNPKRMDENYHQVIIRRANTVGLTNDVEKLILDAVYDSGIDCTTDEIISLRQEIND